MSDRKRIRRDILRLLKNHGNKHFRPKEIAKKLDYHDNRTYRLFRSVLGDMEQKGEVIRVKRGLYTWRKTALKTTEGILRVNPRGFAFVDIEGEDSDVYIPAQSIGTALDGDRVRVHYTTAPRGPRRREGEVQEILAFGRTQIVGTFHQTPYRAVVTPDDERILTDFYIPKDATGDAQPSDKVVVERGVWPHPNRLPEGRIVDILGQAGDPGVDVLALAMNHAVSVGFPQDVLDEAETISGEITRAEIQRRTDLRKKNTFTIDPLDAKDFDDALHIESLPNGHFSVGIHIADVSHFVPTGSALDREGYQRATSTYLVDRVIPMLPEKLSNEVCSLQPHTDKCTFSCLAELTPDGTIVDYQLAETIIHSKARFTYEDAQAMLDGKQDHPLAEDVRRANQLAQTLTRNRMAAGAVDFDRPEVRVVLDHVGHPVEIVRKERLLAHRLIEEFMLLANRIVAEHIGKRMPPHPFVYRVHPPPQADKVTQLVQFVRLLGYEWTGSGTTLSSTELNALLAQVKGTPAGGLVEDAALRSMSKAVYTPQNVGHFGLGLTHYTHFTSPIRRYPDLMVHRLLKADAQNAPPTEVRTLTEQCKHASARERNAEEAERESVKLKQVEYMQRHLGETFDGVISGVTNFGIFVTLNDVFVEGLVHVRELNDDHYDYDEGLFALVGAHTRRMFRLGDPVTVLVAQADVSTRKLDLLLHE